MATRLGFVFVFALNVLSIFPTPTPAQSPTPDQLTLRPGDKIIWFDPSSGHVVQFGGGSLTPLADIQKVLVFEPELEIFENGTLGFSRQGGNPLLTATVKPDAARSGVTAPAAGSSRSRSARS